MKTKTLAAFVAAFGLSMVAATAAHVWEDPSGWWDNHFIYVSGERSPLFQANEVTLDVFATYTALQKGIDDVFETNIRENRNPQADWGGGLGLNYFFTRHLGIGGDINIPDNGGKFVDSINGSLFLRLPWESARLAPYVFGGGGRVTEPAWEWSLHAGAGLEFRFNPVTGIFADARYVWADDRFERGFGEDNKWDGDYLLLRTGIRLAF